VYISAEGNKIRRQRDAKYCREAKLCGEESNKTNRWNQKTRGVRRIKLHETLRMNGRVQFYKQWEAICLVSTNNEDI